LSQWHRVGSSKQGLCLALMSELKNNSMTIL
jgi:hypothetical protein